MTIKEYMEKVQSMPVAPTDGGPSFAETVAEMTSVWSNAACEGYALKAAAYAGLSRKATQALADALQVVFDEMTVEEAATYRLTR